MENFYDNCSENWITSQYDLVKVCIYIYVCVSSVKTILRIYIHTPRNIYSSFSFSFTYSFFYTRYNIKDHIGMKFISISLLHNKLSNLGYIIFVKLSDCCTTGLFIY